MERVTGLISISILARLLAPGQFGIFATAGIVVGIVEIFFSFGFDWALIRFPAGSHGHYSTAWTLRICFAASSAALIIVGAYPASIYFRDPAVIPVMCVLAVATMVGGLENPAMVDFRRVMNFRPEFIVRFSAKLISLIVSATIAWWTRSYWALPMGLLASRIVAVSLTYNLHAFRPTWRLKERTELFSFSFWLLLTNVLWYIRGRIADVFVARQIGAGALGSMSLANELSQLAITELAAPLNRAVYSKLTEHKDDVSQLRQTYLGATSMIWFACFPVALLIGANAYSAVRLLFGDQWQQTAEITRIMAFGSIFGIFDANASYVLIATGQTRFLMSATGWSALASIVALAVLTPTFGLRGAAFAVVISAAVPTPILLTRVFHTLKLPLRDYAKTQWRSGVGACILLGLCLWVAPDIPTHKSTVDALLQLIRSCGIGIVGYLITVYTLWRVVGRPNGAEATALAVVQRYLPHNNPPPTSY
jgi:O-antigen/teichoic acid export membrane protein